MSALPGGRTAPAPDLARAAVRWAAGVRDALLGRAPPARRHAAADPALPPLLDSLADVVWLTAPGGTRIVYASASYARTWGGSTSALYAASDAWLRDVHEDDRARLQLSMAGMCAGRGYATEYRRRAADGSWRWISESARPLAEAGAGRPRFAGLSCDITAHKQAECALRDADRRKDECLAVLAHELRAPLQVIRYAASLLTRLRSAPPVPEARALAAIEVQIDQMARLVDDLLDMTRAAHGKLRLRSADIDLGDVVRAVIDAHRPAAESAGLQLRLAAPEHAVRVCADSMRLTQVFGNLVHNAVKFSAAGGVIDVGIEHAAGEPWVTVSVRDEGAGIAAGQIGTVFDLFAQSEPDPLQASNGLGIGLSVVRTLVELHGGQVSASSAGRGRGSHFVVRLPAQP